MDRISTAFAMQSATSEFLRAQMRQVEAQQQVSTGKRATDMKGYNRDATTLVAARTVQTRVEGFLDNAITLSARLDTQNLAFERLGEIAGEARSTVASAIASGRAQTLMVELNSWLGQAGQALNTKHDGSFVFSGGRVDVAPVAVSDLAALAALPTAGDAFQNENAQTVSRLDESTTAVSGFLADEVGEPLFTLLRDIQIYHAGPNGPLNGNLTGAQSAFLESKLAAFSAAQQGITVTTAENGMIQKRVDDAVKTQESRSVQMEGFISDIAEVDMAEAITRLQQAQAALQASAYTMNVLRTTTLLDLLKS